MVQFGNLPRLLYWPCIQLYTHIIIQTVDGMILRQNRSHLKKTNKAVVVNPSQLQG